MDRHKTDIHGSQPMNPFLVPPAGSHFCFLVKYLDNYWMDCHTIPSRSTVITVEMS